MSIDGARVREIGKSQYSVESVAPETDGCLATFGKRFTNGEML